MNPLRELEPDDRERYDYLEEVLETEFEETHLTFHISGILVYELLNLLAVCAALFEEFGFPADEESPVFRYAVTGMIAEYLEGGYHGL